MNMKNGTWWVLIVILLLIILGLGWMLFVTPAPTDTGANATSTASGTGTNTETNSGTDGTNTGTLNSNLAALHDRVVVDAPKSGQTVFQSFTVTGKAPGGWYFEASFPIKVVDPQGNTIAQGPATALSDWMTTADVAFKADLKITNNYHGPATLVLMNDNPSGMPENQDSISIPIVIQDQ
jgi:hypothetical protein